MCCLIPIVIVDIPSHIRYNLSAKLHDLRVSKTRTVCQFLGIYTQNRIRNTIRKNADWINRVSERYHIPAAAICAILQKEMEQINAVDLAADMIVAAKLFPKKDSSTGPMQIFGKVGLKAINFAVDKGLAGYSELGFPETRRLDENKQSDVHSVWKHLRSDPRANIEIAALNLLSCAEEMTGRIDFDSYSPDELKHIFTRYNQNTSAVTDYGNTAYQYYMDYKKDSGGELPL